MGDQGGQTGGLTCETLEACDIIKEMIQAAAIQLQEQAAEEAGGGWADDATWVLTSSFVILTMQSGFGLLEIGNCMPGHEVNIMLKNVVDVVFGALAYYFLGYGISYGTPSIGFMGLGDFLPDGHTGSTEGDVQSGILYSRYLFQFSFAATSTTIVSGCIAMRMRFFVYCVFSFYAVIMYSFVAHWVWADDGWLLGLGVHDFAGGGPVHLLGGLNGLIAILFTGPRKGRFDGTKPASHFAGASPTSMLFGLFMLWWGWIGFNCGSSFGITDGKWLVATRAGVTTINSTAGGGAIALLYTQWRSKWKLVKPNHVIDGILGSLVAITPCCACIHTYDALIIGAVGALVALVLNELMVHLKIDDPVGAIGAHAGSATFGLLAVGLFADSELPGIDVDNGLFRGGGFRQFGVQLLSIVAITGWSIATASPFFYLIGVINSRKLSDPRKGLRHSEEDEQKGTDYCLHQVQDLSESIVDKVRKSFTTSFRRNLGSQHTEQTAPEADENEDEDDEEAEFASQLVEAVNPHGDAEEVRPGNEGPAIDRRLLFSAMKPSALPTPQANTRNKGDKLVFFKSEPEYMGHPDSS